MTVFCLVELDGGASEGGAAAVADVSLRAITLARGLAAAGATGSAGVLDAGGGGRVAAVVFGGGRSADGPQSEVAPGLVADLAAYGVSDVYAVSGIDGYAPLAWARVLQWLLSASSNPGHAVVAAGTERGNEVLAHLGAITALPMAANCTQAVDNGLSDGDYQGFIAPPVVTRRAKRTRDVRIERSDRSGTDGNGSLYPFWGIRKSASEFPRNDDSNCSFLGLGSPLDRRYGVCRGGAVV